MADEEEAQDVGEQTGGVSGKTAAKIDLETGEIRGPRVTLEGGRLREVSPPESSGTQAPTEILMNAPEAKIGSVSSSGVFINLPVSNLLHSIEFFKKLGFGFEPKFTDANATCMILGKDMFAMLLVADFFKTFTSKTISDAKTSTEVLISLSLSSKSEVDNLVKKASEAGGRVPGEPHDQGWMYGWGFEDLDGHQWELFYMDIDKIPPSPIAPAIEDTNEIIEETTDTEPPSPPTDVNEFSKRANY